MNGPGLLPTLPSTALSWSSVVPQAGEDKKPCEGMGGQVTRLLAAVAGEKLQVRTVFIHKHFPYPFVWMPSQ